MWGGVLGWALIASLNPLLLAFILIILSRPRPVQNMLAFWVGCLIVNVPAFLIPVVVLHLNPTLTSLAQDLAHPASVGSSAVQPVPTATGVLMLSIAALMIVRARLRRPEATAVMGAREQLGRTHAPTPADSTSVMPPDSNEPTAISRGLGRLRDAKVVSAIRGLFSRGQNAWESGSLWVSFLFGLGYFPPPPLVLIVDLIIVGSGAAIATQVSASIVFVLTMLVVVEITLVSYLLAPRRTQAVLGPVHEWAEAHRRHILITLFAVVGVWQLATGVGIT